MHIYKITNLENKKIYIGLSTSDGLGRWKNHLWNASSNANQAIDRAIHKYGKHNFKYNIIEKVKFSKGIKFLENREIYYIHKFSSNKTSTGYNRSLGGNVNVAKVVSKTQRNKAAKQPSAYVVFCYDLNGKLIKKYNSLAKISRSLKTTKANIHKVLNKKNRSASGFQWRTYPNNKPKKKIEKYFKSPKENKIKVFKWDKNGNYIKQYSSISDAAKKNNTSNADVKKVLTGVNYNAKGFIFTYKKELKNIKKKKFKIGGITSKNKIKVNIYSDEGKFLKTCESQYAAAKFLGCDTSEVSKCVLGKNRAYNSKNLKRVVQIKKYSSKKNIKPLLKKLHGSKSVLMYDLNGNFKKKFPSVNEGTIFAKITRGRISESANNPNIIGGKFMWRWFQGKIKKKINKYVSKSKIVLQYNFNGKLIKVHKSIEEAAKSVNTNAPNIRRCVTKNGYSSHQHYWILKKGKIKQKISVPRFV